MGTCLGFNPRTPCGVRQFIKNNAKLHSSFQSTHSLRSATNPHLQPQTRRRVSIHALLAECDLSLVDESQKLSVSIHALLAECDFPRNLPSPHSRSFNPRTPCGVRLLCLCYGPPTCRFQSTHSLRSATQPTLYITTQQSKSYFAPTSLKRPSLHGYTF